MRKWFRFFVLLACLSETLPASDRESRYHEWAAQELNPWFQSQADQFLTSKVPSAHPVTLRYRAFTLHQARGNIVLVHGYGERIEKLMEMAFDFHQAGFNVFALDQRGFGRSTRINPDGKDSIYVERFEDYILDLEQFIVEVVRAQDPRPTFIFAHSMGGLVSTLLLHKRPDLVAGAILSAPMLSIDLKGVPRFMALMLSQAAEGLGLGSSYAPGQVGPRKPEFDDKSSTRSLARWQHYADFYSSPEEWPLSLGGASFHWLGEALRSSIRLDDDAFAKQIKTPVLLFQADQDSYVSPEGQNAFCSRALRCQKIFVPGTRHEIYREQDTARVPYMNSIRQFLDETLRLGQNPATQP